MDACLHVGKPDQDAHAVLAQVGAAGRHPFLTGFSVRPEMRRAVLLGAQVVPAFGAVVRGIGGQLGIELGVELQQDALVHRRHFSDEHAGFPGVSDAGEATDLRRRGAPDLKPDHVELSVRRIYFGVEWAKFEVAGEAHDGGLRTLEARVHDHAEEFGPVVADVDHFAKDRAHALIAGPGLCGAAGVHRMWNPRERLGDGLGILLWVSDGRQVPVEPVVADDVDRRRGNVVPLLVAGRHKSGRGVHADEGLAQAVGYDFEGLAIGCHTNHRTVVLPARRAFLATLGNVERTVRAEFHRVRKLPRLRRLREEVAEHLIAVALTVAVRVHKLPDAIAVEDEGSTIADDDAHRLV